MENAGKFYKVRKAKFFYHEAKLVAKNVVWLVKSIAEKADFVGIFKIAKMVETTNQDVVGREVHQE